MKRSKKLGLIHYYLLFLVFSPCLGIVLMECGYRSIEVGIGRFNLASIAYIVSALVLFLAFRASEKNECRPLYGMRRQNPSTRLGIVTFFNILFLVIVLFVFGTINVFLGLTDKGIQRAGFGAFGSVAYLVFNQLVPANFVVAANAYSNRPDTRNRLFLLVNLVVSMVVGASWGSKATMVTIILPGLCVLLAQVKLKRVIPLFVLFLAIFVGYSMLAEKKSGKFDLKELTPQRFTYSESAITAVAYRATILQGDIPWKIWDMYREGEPFFDYWKTWISILPDKLLYNENTEYSDVIKNKYSLQLTFLFGRAKPTNPKVTGVHNVTGTYFSEGIIAFGFLGMLAYAAVLGVLTGFLYKKAMKAADGGKYDTSTFLLVALFSIVLPVISSGEAYSLFMLSNIVKLAVTYAYIFVVTRMRVR